MTNKICKICFNEFTSTKPRMFCCSVKCVVEFYKKRSEKTKQTCLKKYGVDNVSKIPEIIQKLKNKNKFKSKNDMEKITAKSKQTCQLKYGFNHPSQVQSIKDKIKKTCQLKYNNDTYLGSSTCSEKTKQTCLKKYGVENPMKYSEISKKTSYTKSKYTVEKKKEIADKSIKTCREKYNTDYTFQTDNNKNKTIETYQNKYGVNHPSQVEHIFKKQQISKFKIYILPSGKKIKIQGYEGIYLNEYFKDGKLEENIIIHPTQDVVGKIWYKDSSDQKRRYYPDFYIPTENKIVEVKSVWTMKKELEKNLLKEKACIEYGYNFEFKIYNKYQRNN